MVAYHLTTRYCWAFVTVGVCPMLRRTLIALAVLAAIGGSVAAYTLTAPPAAADCSGSGC